MKSPLPDMAVMRKSCRRQAARYEIETIPPVVPLAIVNKEILLSISFSFIFVKPMAPLLAKL